jgi:hypothetical protein
MTTRGLSMRTFQKLTVGQFEDLASCLGWMFEAPLPPEGGFNESRGFLTRDLVGSFKLRTRWFDKFTMTFTTYYGPGDGMKWTTLEEMAFADSYFIIGMGDGRPGTEEGIQNTVVGQETHPRAAGVEPGSIDIMIAAMYRPASVAGWFRKWLYGGDIRRAFNEEQVLRAAKRVKMLPQYIKDAILLQFIGNRAESVKNNPELYEGDSESGGFGWAGLIINLAGSEISALEVVSKMLWSNTVVFMKKLDWERRKAKAEK